MFYCMLACSYSEPTGLRQRSRVRDNLCVHAQVIITFCKSAGSKSTRVVELLSGFKDILEVSETSNIMTRHAAELADVDVLPPTPLEQFDNQAYYCLFSLLMLMLGRCASCSSCILPTCRLSVYVQEIQGYVNEFTGRNWSVGLPGVG